MMGRGFARAALAAVLSVGAPLAAQPVAHVLRVDYQAAPQRPVPAGDYRNPILPGFQPDPSIVKVGKDFYLVNSTFAWFPGIPIYRSRDLVNWHQIGNAISRPGQFAFSGLATNKAIFAPTISHYGGKFRILDTCVGCGGNFMITADRPEGPWSDPVWLPFDGIDPSLFVDRDGSAWVLNDGPPAGPPRYDGHRAIWIQRVDLATGKMIGPRKVLVDGGVHPQDKPVWVEGPHLFRVGGYYYLMPAEGGTAEEHSETIYRSRRVDGPYVPGPINPILTQKDLPRPRPERVEATGHADLVRLDNGRLWAVFLGTRPFAGQSTLLGRETFLLPVQWRDGWPVILPKGEAVPLVEPRPDLPVGSPIDWSHWQDRFSGSALAPQWLMLRTPVPKPWYRLDHGLDLVARSDAPGSMKGQPAFLGRRLRHRAVRVTVRLDFAPERAGDFGGLMAYMNEEHFMAFGITRNGDGALQIAVRERRDAKQPDIGVTLFSQTFSGQGPVDLRIAIEGGRADFSWRNPEAAAWHVLARNVDVEPLASVHGGLFTGLIIGPYAQRGQLPD